MSPALAKQALPGARLYIIDYFSSRQQPVLLAFLSACDWRAARFLHTLLTEQRFSQVLGPDGHLFFLMHGQQPVGFVTLTQKDCIDDETLLPWLGFLYVTPAWQNQGCAGKLLRHAMAAARTQGRQQVYLATDHVGFYERYGFTYLHSRLDVYGDMSRIYTARLVDCEEEAKTVR